MPASDTKNSSVSAGVAANSVCPDMILLAKLAGTTPLAGTSIVPTAFA